MALQLSYQLTFSRSFFEACKPKRNIQHNLQAKTRQNHLIWCGAKSKVYQADSRLAIYQPTIWSHDLIQVLDDNFPVNFEERVRELEKKVVNDYLNNGCFRTLELLEHIDDIQRLGLGYRFQNHIQRLLDVITSLYKINEEHDEKEESLHQASLRFRILRQHGYNVSQDFLRKFKDSHHGFIKYLNTDVKGLLSLYEASHLAFMEESDLHEAKLYATEHLLKLKAQENDSQALERINHALEGPLYYRMIRLQARCYIYAYNKRKDANLHLLELAILDFNRIQAAYKTELKEVSKWWKNLGLAQELSFVRDRLMECFFWTVGVVDKPQCHSCRVGLTKVGALITVIDDIYDIYGSLDELEIFRNVVKSSYKDHLFLWDLKWGELLEAFLVEAKWTQAKYIPKLEDYLDNAWRSVSGVVILTHGYFLTNQEIKKDVIESLERYGDLMKWSSMIFRLYNDLATSTENGVCEEVARAYIKTLIVESWRRLIKVYVACSQDLANPFIDMAINLARISCCTYQYGDGHGAPDARAKDRVFSVIIKPITVGVKEHKYT